MKIKERVCYVVAGILIFLAGLVFIFTVSHRVSQLQSMVPVATASQWLGVLPIAVVGITTALIGLILADRAVIGRRIGD